VWEGLCTQKSRLCHDLVQQGIPAPKVPADDLRRGDASGVPEM